MSNQSGDSVESSKTPENSQKNKQESSVEPTLQGHSFRRLMVFQLKLAVDALRDIMLSPVSIVCTIVDSIEKKHGADSYFEKLMAFGRSTERKINLFEQHAKESSTIDSVFDRVEDVIVDEYQNKNISKKTLAAIQQALNKEKDNKK